MKIATRIINLVSPPFLFLVAFFSVFVMFLFFISQAQAVNYYSPTSLNVVNGDDVSGIISDVLSLDGNNLYVSETGSATPLTVDFIFANIDDFDRVYINWFYNGSPTHNISFQVYNYNTSSFDTFFYYLGTTTSFDLSDFIVGDTIDYISSTNDVIIRFNHVSTGITSHYAEFDYIALYNSDVVHINDNQSIYYVQLTDFISQASDSLFYFTQIVNLFLDLLFVYIILYVILWKKVISHFFRF